MSFVENLNMHNEFNPVLQLKAQKITENQITENTVETRPAEAETDAEFCEAAAAAATDAPQNSVETKRGFNTPVSLSPIVVRSSPEAAKLAIVGKLKFCLEGEANGEKESKTEDLGEKVISAWGVSLVKAKIAYNPEDYPALSARKSVKIAKFLKPSVLDVSAKVKDDFAKDMAKNLTSSMSSRPTLYARPPNMREKGFAALKNGQGFEKTAMCKWGKRCRNKEKCTYAHNEAELAPRMCAFGKGCHKHSCHFPHDEDEANEWKKTHIEKWLLSQKLGKLPRAGYVCRSCGKEGGCEDSHWVRDCPRKKKRSAPGAGYVCKCCGQKGGEKGAHWVQQCPKSSPFKKSKSPQKRSPKKSKSPQKRSPKKLKVTRSPNKEGWVKV